MAEDNRSLNSAETNNETSWYKAFGAGLLSGAIKIPEGIVSLGAELIDLGADSDTASSVEEFFDDINIFEDTAEERTIGKLTEAITQIAVPGGIGFKAANAAARKLTTKALKAKRKGAYLEFGKKGKTPSSANLRSALQKVNDLNKRSKYKRFAAAVTGGAAGEGLVVDTDEIGTFGDMFEGPTSLNRDESLSGREDATRKLMNRFKFGTESLLVTPFAFGVGATAKSLAKRGKDLAYSSSQFERFIDKYIRAPFSPRGNLPDEVFKSEMLKQGLKTKDSYRAKQIVANITKVVDGIFPVSQEVADKSIKAQKLKFVKDVNDVLLDGDLAEGIDPTKLKNIIDQLDVKNVSKEQQELLADALNAGRGELNSLIDILQQTSGGASKGAQGELKELFKKRLEGYVGNTFRIFETKSNLFNLFRKYTPTEESYKNAIKVFGGGGMRTEQEAREIVDQILDQAQKMKKPKPLPDFKYTQKSAETGKLKSFEIGLGGEAGGTAAEKKALRELFGEIKDPRFTLFNGMTNLSGLARTSAYLAEVQAKNADVQARGGRGFFWDSAEEAAEKLDTRNTGIEIVPMREVLGEIDATKNLINPLQGTYTTREIAEGIKTANDVMGSLQGFVRGTKQMTGAEKGVSWFYRNLLLFPKGVSQMAKTIFSIPTHLRNFFSAGAFSAANGLLFEGLTNPGLLKRAFAQGIDVSALLKAGPGSKLAQKEYQDLLELGVTNSQVQLGDLISLLKDTNAGETMMGLDNILGRMFKKFKKGGEFLQGKYMAEDDTFKITNYVVELDRLKKSAVLQGLDVTDEVVLRGLKQQAADIVKNTVPNYSFVGSAVEDMSIGRSESIASKSVSQGDYIIKTAYASVDVSSSKFNSTISEVENLVKEYEGNISNTYLSTNYQGLKSYSLTMNVPAEDFEIFLTQIETVSEFSNISSNANDVTEYVLDIDSRLKALNNEKIALEEIKKEATSTSDKLQVQAQLRYINQDIEMLQGQKEYYEKSTSYSTLTLEIREGSGVSLFSWNYYVQRALSWIETIIGISISLSFVIGPLMLIYFVVKKIRNKN